MSKQGMNSQTVNRRRVLKGGAAIGAGMAERVMREQGMLKAIRREAGWR